MHESVNGQEQLIRLTPEHEIKHFDCDDTDLNDFLLNQSQKYSDQLLAVTYLLENDKETIAFFSILNDKITLKEKLNKPIRQRLLDRVLRSGKNLRSFPAVKIARLGVHKTHQRKDTGTTIIAFLIDSLLSKNKTGCRFITVDAYQNSHGFYEKNGFRFLTKTDAGKDIRLMYLDLLPFKDC